MTKDIGTREVLFGGKDAVVCRKVLADIPGGVVLDTDDYEGGDRIFAGHLVIKNPDDNTYKPMPVEDGAYSSLPDGYEYAGVVITTTLVAEPLAPVMIAGDVNVNAIPYSIDDIEDAVKEVLPTITWTEDAC